MADARWGWTYHCSSSFKVMLNLHLLNLSETPDGTIKHGTTKLDTVYVRFYFDPLLWPNGLHLLMIKTKAGRTKRKACVFEILNGVQNLYWNSLAMIDCWIERQFSIYCYLHSPLTNRQTANFMMFLLCWLISYLVLLAQLIVHNFFSFGAEPDSNWLLISFMQSPQLNLQGPLICQRDRAAHQYIIFCLGDASCWRDPLSLYHGQW